MMKRLDDQASSWDTIAGLIQRYVLPAIEVVGTTLFYLPSASPFQRDRGKCAKDVRILYPLIAQRAVVLGFIVQGYGEMLLGETFLTLQAGQGIVVPPGVPYSSHVARQDRVPFSDWLWFAAYPYGVLLNRCQLIADEHRSSPVYFVADPLISGLLHRWYSQPDRRHGKWLLLTSFSLLAEATPMPMGMVSDLKETLQVTSPTLQLALQWLHRHYDAPFSLKALAAECSVSPNHLCRLFRRYLGTTPLGYLTRLRLTIARRLLEETPLSVHRVAEFVGYHDLRLFRRHFRRYFQAPPHHFRQ